MSENAYDVGIVGCGSMGHAHARSYRRDERTNVVAAAEPDGSTRSEFLAEFDGVTGYETHDAMLADERLDVVSVCTLHSTHAAITVDAARADVAGVWCEKPMATSLGEARDMLDAVERNGVKLTVGHKRRFHPVHERARALVADGAIGDPQFVTGRTGGGLLNWGTHVIDLARYLLGDPDLAWVMGQVERRTDRHERGLECEDRCVGQACFEDGTRLTYESDMPGPAATDSALSVTGSAGRLDVDLDTAVTVTTDSGTETYAPEPEYHELYDPYLAAHVDWLDGRRDGHRCDAATGHDVVELMMGIYESARTRGVVESPVGTRANPLAVMIEDGDLPVEQPGAYDIRVPYRSVRGDE